VCTIGAASTGRAIRHAADVVGVDHVALGSDFDGTTRMPFDTSGLVQVTQALLDQGFNPGEIARIMGDNVLRLLRENLPGK
jgi:microsomal dipeptidase-like Zn-dependent dipeptidase